MLVLLFVLWLAFRGHLPSSVPENQTDANNKTLLIGSLAFVLGPMSVAGWIERR